MLSLMLLAKAVVIYVSDIWAIFQSNQGFWIFFCISLNSCHVRVPKCLHFKKLILSQTETGLGQRTYSDILKSILPYSRAKYTFLCVNWSWIETSVSRKSPTFTLRLWKWEKNFIMDLANSIIKSVIKISNVLCNIF